MCGAFLSHPADTIVSKLNNTKTEGSLGENLSKIYREIGFKGLWRGLNSRLHMIGALVGKSFNFDLIGVQLWFYETFKTLVGIKTIGAKS